MRLCTALATSVTFNGVGSGIVENNLFLDPYNYEWRQPYQYASVEIRNTDGISLTGNRLYLASPFTSGKHSADICIAVQCARRYGRVEREQCI